MAKNVTVLKTGRVVFAGATHIWFTPWTDDATPGSQTYDLVNVVADSISVEQEDNEVNEKLSEFSNEPLIQNISLGKYNLSVTAIDFQNDVVKNLFGWKATEDMAAAPTAYKDLFCEVEIAFGDGEPIIVMPKILLNSKAVIQTLKTGTAEAMIQGSAYSAFIKAGSAEEETTLAIIPTTNATTYTVSATHSA